MSLVAVILALSAVHERYDRELSPQMATLVADAIRFRTVEGNAQAQADQKAWLLKTAGSLGLVGRDAGTMTEIELPGPPGAPVLGLVVHGDVQPVDEAAWTLPPFAGVVKDGLVIGRGAADDKGPLAQALLALATLARAGPPRTHTVRLLVGTDEESGSKDVPTYLESHLAPDYSLVLDSEFPVVVGEKAWNALTVTAPREGPERPSASSFPYGVASVEAGLAPSIVPDRARLVLRWREGAAEWAPLIERLLAHAPPRGTRVELTPSGNELEIRVYGRAAHAGVNLEGGRNALVALAQIVDGQLPPSGPSDLLAFAALAGKNLHGTALGLTDVAPLWRSYAVNVATLGTSTRLAPGQDGNWTLAINIRRPPPLTGRQLQAHLEKIVAEFAKARGAKLVAGGFYADEPLAFDPQAKIVRRLMDAYGRATGRDDPPAISGGGTYAKRLPRSIAFGMWFPDKPYPGHDADEKVPLADLHRGVHVLIEALLELACGERMLEPFRP